MTEQFSVTMSRSATLAGPGTLRAPLSHCWMARTVHSRAAASCCVVRPSRSRMARTSAGVIRSHPAFDADELNLPAEFFGEGEELAHGLVGSRRPHHVEEQFTVAAVEDL